MPLAKPARSPRTDYMPLAKPAGSPRTDYMPLQNLKEHPRTDYMPCNTCVPYYYIIIFRSSHHLTEHSQIHITQHLHPPAWEDQPTTI